MADSLPPDAEDSEWESSYAGWHELYAEAEDFISQSDYEDLCPGDKTDLLYALARDNEDEILADALRRRPELLVAVAEDALGRRRVQCALASRRDARRADASDR